MVDVVLSLKTEDVSIDDLSCEGRVSGQYHDATFIISEPTTITLTVSSLRIPFTSVSKMPSVQLHTGPRPKADESLSNPLPSLLQTPSGLAILEIQGTIHGPSLHSEEQISETQTTTIGRLEFPLYSSTEPAAGKWMKKVYLYVGKHQRLTGEIKKLAKPLAIIRKCDGNDQPNGTDATSASATCEDLEVVEIVKYKLLFSGRPEPVGE
ncbi:hypothetical protein LTR99_004021 [Exophiala xenobiotica]|uniref:Chromosome transmission fidelity protein 8 n=1 Tax=Vermiconidia calcicola TaxID=1690605 RepID=A0AAV9PU44_9PEZI|nr:hypothetical protein LTR99_004021 [Exophiala xenobiotica]KAK5435488.1 hypothetical protein LTR34_002992 [Exophiala xenobiotica]KAK5529661.1 hypothetical protein LTR25_009440 [Vermiconidia calcicola]KAK5549135.1 hypothetical protein LTR23_000965 [Chaetothyriales sp. CCFEE 6169]